MFIHHFTPIPSRPSRRSASPPGVWRSQQGGANRLDAPNDSTVREGEEAPVLRQITIVGLTAAVSAVAAAQEVQQIEPTWRVITRDGVALRCGPESVFYAVAEYNTGRMLQVDGVIGSQARVRYPHDLAALVPADEVREVGSGVVELVRASSLRAPSVLMGLSGSWKGLYDADLPAGTRLTVRETLKNDRGQVVGYRVDAPRPPAVDGHPRAFVPADALRDATPEEIEKHLAQHPAPAASATAPAPAPAESGPVPPADSTPSERQPPAEAPRQTPAEPAPETRPADPSGTIPADLDPAGSAAPRTAPAPIAASKLEDLEASFAAARKLPPAQLDEALEELLAEYRRTRAEAGEDERLAAQLDMRIEWLRLRIETRDQRRAIEAALNTATERSRALEQQVAEWRQGRAFELVGRLVVSTVYNGERLPRMYRVQSVSPVDGATRTLGYVTPTPEVEAKLGRVVGVVGEPRFDPQLRLVVIRPDQIDVMPE